MLVVHKRKRKVKVIKMFRSKIDLEPPELNLDLEHEVSLDLEHKVEADLTPILIGLIRIIRIIIRINQRIYLNP